MFRERVHRLTVYTLFEGTSSKFPELAESLIAKMVERAVVRMELGLSPVKTPCMEPYMFPETAKDLALSTGLVKSVVKANTNPLFWNFLDSILENTAGRGIDPEDRQGKPFLVWLCERPNDPLCTLK